MFVLSEMHDWQGDAAVKQVLLFPDQEIRNNFVKAYNEVVEKIGLENASDSNLGAIYKIRAVKQHDGKYEGVIRCGVTGKLLMETHIKVYSTPEEAIKACFVHIVQSLKETFSKATL